MHFYQHTTFNRHVSKHVILKCKQRIVKLFKRLSLIFAVDFVVRHPQVRLKAFGVLLKLEDLVKKT